MSRENESRRFHQQFAPASFEIGFVNENQSIVADELYAWRKQLNPSALRVDVAGGLDVNVELLAPFTNGVAPREIVVGTSRGNWSSIFRCGIPWPEAGSSAINTALRLKCRAVAVMDIPERRTATVPDAPWGARQFLLYGPESPHPMGVIRTITLAQDGNRWDFHTFGDVQPFEDVDTYGERRKKNRLSTDMLTDYANAVGLDPFSPDFYSGPTSLIEVKEEAKHPGLLSLSREEAKRRAGF